jgi:hypothetical protein
MQRCKGGLPEPTALASAALQAPGVQHDLPPVGVCVAVATPPGDKSAPRITARPECDISIGERIRHFNLGLTGHEQRASDTHDAR